MLCNACDGIFDNARKTTPGTWSGGPRPSLFDYDDMPNTWAGAHHVVEGSFRLAAERRCYICLTLLRDCNRMFRTQSQYIHTFYQLRRVDDHKPKHPSRDRFELEFTFEVSRGEGPTATKQVVDCTGVFKIFPKKEVNVTEKTLGLTENTFAGKCCEQIQSWLECCYEDHARCKEDWRTSNSYPSRLLNIDREKGKVFLEAFANRRDHPPYATLSHCWQAGMTTKLTGKTFRELEKGLQVSGLPKRFKEAIDITSWMQLKYLWIDALCIIQDSEADWAAESVRMGDIYAGSYCNIAATSSNEKKGCFTSRDVELVEPYSISSPRANRLEETHVIAYDDFWSNSLLDTNLHTRGWVLQERLLSPRTIHFGQEQMFWECRCEMACEAYPDRIPEPFRNARTRNWRQSDRMIEAANKSTTKETIERRSMTHSLSRILSRLSWWQSPKKPISQLSSTYAIWSRTVERYMECELTYSADKLVALSGVAQRVAQQTGDDYLAGLWQTPTLSQSLMWYVLGRKRANSAPSIRSPSAGKPGYRAPSFSWASIDARIVWNWPSDCERVLIDIGEITVGSSSGNKMGRILAAQMDVRGHLFKAKLRVANTTADGVVEEDGSYILQLTKKHGLEGGGVGTSQLDINPTIFLDTPLLPSLSIQTMLLPVCTGWRGRSGNAGIALAGLLLRLVTSRTSNYYERIGIFGLDHQQADSLCGITSGKTEGIAKVLERREKSEISLV